MSIRARFQLAHPGFRLDVDLQLPAKGVSALFGPSGCGKTTLLRCMAGLARAERGHLVVQGDVWQSESAFVPTHQRSIGYVFQDAALFAHLNVRRNLLFGQARIQAGASASTQSQPDFDSVVQLLGLDALLERQPACLSGGERQRVAIGRALLSAPRLLLMDEPLAALDLARKQEVLPYLERLRDTLDIPMVYVSHAPDEVARLADHLVVLQDGQVLASGALTETLARVDLPIQLGEDAGVVLQAQVLERDTRWHLARVGFSGGSLWVRDAGHAVGSAVRVRILARDVSIALEKVEGISIQNSLQATVEHMAADYHPALSLLRLRVGPSPLLARLTQRAAAGLALEVGTPVWVQIKAVALIG